MKSFLLAISLVALFAGCKKHKDDTQSPAACDIKGTYVGTATASAGNSSSSIYEFKDNNFAVGYLTVGGPGVTFGGYRNTCDSVVVSVYYTDNGDYYLIKGAFNSTRTVISGTYQDLNSGIHGVVTMTKL